MLEQKYDSLDKMRVSLLLTDKKHDKHPMICIDSENFKYSMQEGRGHGIQTNYADDIHKLENMCNKISEAILEYLKED